MRMRRRRRAPDVDGYGRDAPAGQDLVGLVVGHADVAPHLGGGGGEGEGGGGGGEVLKITRK